jgi:hypothetical protein
MENNIINRIKANTPLWFRKLKRIITFLSDAAVVILLAMGYSENSLILLIFRVGISAVINSVETFLSFDGTPIPQHIVYERE